MPAARTEQTIAKHILPIISLFLLNRVMLSFRHSSLPIIFQLHNPESEDQIKNPCPSVSVKTG